MYRKFLILVVITFGFGVMTIAQTISGSVTDQDGNPLSFSSVYVEEIQKGTSVDFEGKYEIKINTYVIFLLSFSILWRQRWRRCI